jgi:hypothetical protein
MKKILVYSAGFLLLCLITVQFITFNTVQNPNSKAVDMLTITNPSTEVTFLVKNACYDCHSNTTAFPWYYKIAPVSWMINSHISEALENVNFSDWSDFNREDQIGILKSCSEKIEENEMPLFTYKIMHPLARLDEKEKALITNWIKSFIIHNENLPENTDEN